MDSVFKKMNLKPGQRLLVCDAPASFLSSLGTLDQSLLSCHSQEQSSAEPKPDAVIAADFFWPDFLLIFVHDQAQLDRALTLYPQHTQGDVLLWFAYPKRTSKRYHSDLHRDHSWHGLGLLGFEAVRQVAIDEDWSALRFRRSQYITQLKRDPQRALSVDGKRRTRQSKS